MKKLLLALLLSSCVSNDADQAGNPYPPECAVDVLLALAPPSNVIDVDQATLQGIAHDVNHKYFDEYSADFLGIENVIFVDKALKGGWKYADAIRHGNCHRVAGALWHRPVR